jgi:hypothetical protein
MKSVLRWALLGGAICLFVLVSNTTAIAQSSGPACTRESLKAITDKFFAALEAHKPSGVPLASGVKYTENGMVVAVGKGSWETAGKTTFKRGLIDTQKCGTHTQAIIDEAGKPMLYGVRLKVDKENTTIVEGAGKTQPSMAGSLKSRNRLKRVIRITIKKNYRSAWQNWPEGWR